MLVVERGLEEEGGRGGGEVVNRGVKGVVGDMLWIVATWQAIHRESGELGMKSIYSNHSV